MSLFVLDTDILSLYYHGDRTVVQRIGAQPADELAISVITVDEQLTGWYRLARHAGKPERVARAYSQLTEIVVRLGRWRIITYSEVAISRAAQLKALRLNIGMMDLRIAAIALEHNAVLVTRNIRDFARIPGLRVEDWSK